MGLVFEILSIFRTFTAVSDILVYVVGNVCPVEFMYHSVVHGTLGGVSRQFWVISQAECKTRATSSALV